MKAEEYLNVLTEQIRCKRARDAVQEELRCHIEDQTDAWAGEGMERSEAEARAVKEMGDPVEAGVALDRIHRPKMAWGLIFLVVCLSLAGFAVQFWLQKSVPGEVFIPNSAVYLLYLLAGLGVMAGICILDYTWIARWPRVLTILLFAALYLGMRFTIPVNGTSSWFTLFGISVNVRMAVFLFIPLYGAVLYRLRGQGYGAVMKGILWMLPGLFIAVSCSGLVTAGMLFLPFLATFAAAVYKDWFRIARKMVLGILGGVTLCFPFISYGWFMLFGAEYQKARLQAVLHPESLPLEGGYQIMMVRKLLEKSRLIGGGPDSVLQEAVIPDRGSFVLTYLISCYGILAALLLLGLMIFLFSRLLHVSLRQKNQLGTVIGVGCISVFLIQMLNYVLSNLGFLFAGMNYCPFLTRGGSGMVVTYVLLGFLLSIYRYQNVSEGLPGNDQRRNV